MKKFRKKGLDKASQRIVEGLEVAGIQSKSVLEVGCGVGGLHLTLLQKGASLAQGVDASGGMLEAAANLAQELKLAQRVTYHQGDFVELNSTLAPADIVVMDKVLCCYAEPEALIAKGLSRARELFAVSYPRNSLLAWLSCKVPSVIGRILRWSFRPYYHAPAFLDQTIVNSGFQELSSSVTPVWQIKIYTRKV